MRLVATIEQREVIERILGHLGLPTALPAPRPARAPPLGEEVFDTGADLPVYETSVCCASNCLTRPKCSPTLTACTALCLVRAIT